MRYIWFGTKAIFFLIMYTIAMFVFSIPFEPFIDYNFDDSQVYPWFFIVIYLVNMYRMWKKMFSSTNKNIQPDAPSSTLI